MPQPSNTSVSLDPHFTDFISAQVKDGHYDSASDVIRAGLQLLEEQEEHLKVLNDAIEAGLASGPSVAIDRDEFLKQMSAQHAAGV